MKPMVARCVLSAFVLFTAGAVHAAPLTLTVVFSPGDNVISETASALAQNVNLTDVDVLAGYGTLGIGILAAESNGTGAWRDEWTITGGTGAGTLMVDWLLEGTITVGAPNPVCTTCVADSATVTYSSMFGTTSIFQPGTVIASPTQPGPGSLPVQMNGTLEVPFTYGTAFGAGFRLSGGFGDDYYGGTIDFLNTASVTAVTLPTGASLTAASGALYPIVTTEPPPAPVPEPATLLLVGSSLAALSYRRRARLK